MKSKAFGRLVNLYRERLIKLFGGSVSEMLAEPWVFDSPKFKESAWAIAQEMAREVAHANASSWRVAAAKSTNAKKIYAALQQEIEYSGLGPSLNQIARANATLIGSLPQYVARKVSAHAAELQREGKRPAEIAWELRKIAPHLTRSRIDMIARTEVSKAETDLTKMRSQRLGVDWAVWVTSQDQRVRPSHKNLNGVLMNWSDPPAPEALIGEKSTLGHGFAGTFPNCRCLMLPLISLDEVTWPAKAYRFGKIQRISRSQFTKLAGIPLAA